MSEPIPRLCKACGMPTKISGSFCEDCWMEDTNLKGKEAVHKGFARRPSYQEAMKPIDTKKEKPNDKNCNPPK